MRVSYEAKEEVGDGLKELNCHCERKHAQKTTMNGQIIKTGRQRQW